MLMYGMQVGVLALVALMLFRNRLPGTTWYCTLWLVGVVAIRSRYGATEEVLFYSNDQRHHAVVTNALVELGIRSDWGYMLRSGRIAYTLPSAIIQWLGFETVLALKFVSLISFLLAATIVVGYLNRQSTDDRLVSKYLTMFGPAGVFFSLLALREMMMMLFVTLFFVALRRASKVLSLVAIATLRPHLAAALVVGLALAPLALWLSRRIYYVALAAMIVIPAVLGNAGYSVGVWLLDGGNFGLARAVLNSEAFTRILTNLVGLQFLSVDSRTTNLNFADLMLARIPFLETILIPLLFTLTMLFVPKLTTLRWQVFGAFSFYLGLVTVTDFNSFRQNVPFMAVFGLVVVTEGIQHFVDVSRSNAPLKTRSLTSP